MIARCNGSEDVISFNDSVKSLLYDFYRRNRLENDEDKLRITKLAAELIRSNIQEINYDKQSYFCLNDLSISTMLSFIPESLQYFIQNLFSNRSKIKDVKVAASGQPLIQIARPNTVFCPSSFGTCCRDPSQMWVKICSWITPCF